jgi:hypothetical protein
MCLVGGDPVMKWVSFIVVLAVVVVLMWRFKVFHSIGGAFDDWLHWIGAR